MWPPADTPRVILAIWAAALAAGAGVVLSTAAVEAAPAVVVTGIVAVVALGALVGFRRGAVVTPGVALCFAYGLASAWRATQPPAPAPFRAAEGEQGRAVACRGRVAQGPIEVGPAAFRLHVDLISADGRPARARVRLTARARRPRVLPGDLVEFDAVLRVPRGLANPGLPDLAHALRAAGVDLVAAVPDGEAVRVVASGPRLAPRRLALVAHDRLALAVDAALEPRLAAFVRAIAIGDRHAVDPRVERDFRAAGATHILSVSGLHMASVAALAFLGLRRLAAAWPWLALRVAPSAMAAAVALPLTAFYAVLSGQAVATMRAAAMAALGFGALLLARPPPGFAAAGGAALALLAGAPLQLGDPSFQLSFTSVLTLMAWSRGRAVDRALRGRIRKTWDKIRDLVVLSTVAFVATAPIVAHHFAETSPAAPLGNLLLIPLVELVVLPLALGGAVLAVCHPVLGTVPLLLAGAATDLALAVAAGFGRWAPVVPVSAPSEMETLLLCAAGGVFLLASARPPPRRRLVVAGVGLALLGVAGMAARQAARLVADDVRVTFLDVGQGDAAVIEGPRGFVAVVDAGGAMTGTFDPGARVVEPYLRRRGVNRIDLMILSHPHPDHMNGLFHLLDRFPVRRLWLSGDRGGNPEFDRLVALARARGVDLSPPERLFHRGLTLTALAPRLGERIGPAPGLSVNNASLVVRAEFSGKALLLPGDIEVEGEAELVASGEDLRADVLKVPHHGSRTSSSEELLAVVRPAMAVASLGFANRFKFPAPEVAARYRTRGAAWYRTDRDGAVVVKISRAGTLAATTTRRDR